MSPPSGDPAARGAGERTQDFDLHGVVGLRVLDASLTDLATVRRQLGPMEGTLHREPDITIRFVDSLDPGAMTLVGVGDTGFAGDQFFLLRGRGGAEGRTTLPFDRIGGRIEIMCERRLPAVPHLLAVINLTALAKGVLPLHATAFTAGSIGVLVTGWSKGGKTEALLGCMAEGGAYVGDEWIYLADDGLMLGLPEPIRIWAWQLDQMPALWGARPGRERRRLRVWRALAALAESAARTGLPGSSLAHRAHPVLGRQAYLQIPPADLFGADRVPLRGHLDAVVLVMSHEGNEIVTRSAAPGEIAERMRASLEEERAPLMTHYRHFRYAFPDRTNSLIDEAPALESKLLTALLDDRPCAKVVHPHPCDVHLLGRAVLKAAQTARQQAAVHRSPAGSTDRPRDIGGTR
jgi:hypothetical protein